MKRLLVVLVVGAALGAAAVAWFARGDAVHRTAAEPQEAGLTVQRSVLRPGIIMLVARNDGAEAVRIAQVLVNDAFVDFRAQRLTVAPGRRIELDIPYAWVERESYEIGLLTGTGAIVAYELEDAGAT